MKNSRKDLVKMTRSGEETKRQEQRIVDREWRIEDGK